jgi:hypothetical protein
MGGVVLQRVVLKENKRLRNSLAHFAFIEHYRSGVYQGPTHSYPRAKKVSKVGEDIESEYIGIVNYCVIAMLQEELGDDTATELSVEEVDLLFDRKVQETKELMFAKNHDYGEAWRDMRISSLTDLILMKLLRVKQIEDNDGQTLASEGIKANYQDMLNYSVFALIKISEGEKI